MTDLELFARHADQWWTLEKSGAYTLCKSQNWHCDGRNYYGDTPVYQVFKDGKRVLATTNYLYAVEYMRKVKQE